MYPGACSVSLAVKDLAASRQFYEALGFAPFAGDPAQPADESGTGPARFVVVDPDGNQIPLDQHV